jgi:hypothetical protein
MGKSRRQDKMKANAAERRSSAKTPKSGRRPRSRRLVAPFDEKQMESVAGIPDEAEIDEVAHNLGPGDRMIFKRVRRLLAEHLGSHPAARLWLVSPGTGFETTALDAVRKGQAKVVLETLNSQWGPSPTYA